MAPRPPDRSKRFNELVGNRTGRPTRVRRPTTQKAIEGRRVRANTGAGRKAISTYVQHGGGKVSSTARKQNRSWTGGSTDVVAPATQSYENIFDTLSSDLSKYNSQVMNENAMRTAYAAQVLDQQVDPNNPRAVPQPLDENGKPMDPLRQLAPSIDEQYLGNTLNEAIITPLTKVASTIPSAIYHGAQRGFAAEAAGKGDWAGFVESIKGVPSGFVKPFEDETGGHTLFGQTDTSQLKGPGNIYELWKNEGDSVFAQGARKLERELPFVEQQVARGLGGAGEWFLHPMGRFVGAGKAPVINGRRASPESVRQYANEMAQRWAADVEDQIITGAQKGPGGYRPFPSEQAMADHFYTTLTDVFDHAESQITSGGSKGRYEVLNPKMTAGLAGSHGAQALQESLTSLFSSRTQYLVDGIRNQTPLTGQALDQWASLNPDFTDLLDNLANDLVSQGRLPANPSTNMLAGALGADDIDLIRQHEQFIVDQRYSPYIQQAADDIAREFRNSYYHAPGLRVGKTVYPVKAVGRAYASLNAKSLEGVSKNFRYNSVFPGSLSLDTTRARAWGVRATEEFEKEVRDNAKGVSKADGIAIQHAIEDNNIHTLDPDLQMKANWIKDQYRWMYDEEFLAGARGRARDKPNSSSTPYDPNYTFVHNKGGTLDDRKRWKDDRKATIHANVRAGNGEGAGRYKTSNSKAENFRPVENAFEALRQRRIKYNRDMIRAKFLNDMIDKYSISSRIHPGGRQYAAQSRGLEKVNFHKLPEHLKQAVEQSGEEVFIPKEMAQMINTFDDITKWYSGRGGRIERSFAEVIRILKKAQTLYWPGFHNKNMIGDVFMGLLDNILPHHYAQVIQKGMASINGKNSMFRILKQNPGLDIGFREMWAKYQHEANSGFISSELGTLESSTARWNIPRRAAARTEAIAVGISGFREDAGRFTHYTTAYKQEANELWKMGERDLAVIDRKASSAALWRVNNYKFDYNALMLWEKKAKTLYFPFYTFMRKAAPTLFQALYQDPRWIAAWTRYMHQNQMPDGQEGADSFDGFRVPEDIRDTGFAFVGGQADEPTYVTNDILPTSVFNQVRTGSTGEFANSVLSQAALPFQVGIEQGTGQQLFLDRPLKDQDFGQYMLDKVPGTRELDQFFDSDKSWIDKFQTGEFFDPDKSWGERLTTSRIGAGLPIKTLSEQQQLFAEQEWRDKLIDDPLQQVNYSQDLYYISRQHAPDGKALIFTVKNNTVLDTDGNATVVASFYTPEDAIQYVKKNLPDSYKKVPTTFDIDNQGNPIRREVGG